MSQGRGIEIVALVETWIAERDLAGDYEDYERQGKVNRQALAVELGFARSCYSTNSKLLELLHATECRWFGEKKQTINSYKAAAERSDKKATETTANNNKLTEEIARLKAENLSLRRQLEKFAAMDEVIKATGLVRP